MVRWVIQNNLINENDLKEVNIAAIEAGAEVEEVMVIPFSPGLPEFKHDENNVYYGSTTFMYNIYKELKPKGLFFNDNFNMTNYNEKWWTEMLNYEAIVTTFGEIENLSYDPEQLFFIRPNEDDKSFDGKMMAFKDIQNWRSNFVQADNVTLTESTKILLGEPYNIKKEWRNFIVGGKIVASSLYREDFRVKKSATDIPDTMLDYVNMCIAQYKPHENFVIDIALCGGSYYIIECGCINSCGFYHANIKTIVTALTNWMNNVN